MFRFLIPGLAAALKSKALRILDTQPMWLNLVRPSISVGYRKPEGAAPQLSSSTHDFPSTQRPLTCPGGAQTRRLPVFLRHSTPSRLRILPRANWWFTKLVKHEWT